MKDWQPTSGELISVKGFSNDTQATYIYYVDGIKYQNNRVYVTEFKDNIGSYHQDLYRKLTQLHNTKQPVTLWYNPYNPQSSVLDREMRWGLFGLMTGFCSIFIIIGLGVCYASVFSKTQNKYDMPSHSKLKKEWRQKQSDPKYKESYFDFIKHKRYELAKQSSHQEHNVTAYQSTPWLEKKEWKSNHIRSGAKTSMITMWAFAIVWNAISLPLIFAFGKEWEKGNYAILIALLFPLAGAFLLKKAIQISREWLRFGVLEIVLDPFPGSIGGHVGGSLEINKLYDLKARYNVELECVFSYVSGSGENRSRRESIKWAEVGLAKVESTGRGIRLAFRFNIPDDLPEADIEQSEDYYFWRLKVIADIPGVNLNREYNLPVFKTGKKSRHINHDISEQAQSLREREATESKRAVNRGEFHDTALVRSLRYRTKGNELSFYFPMFRNKVLTVFALIFAGVFGFATYSMYTSFGGHGFAGIFVMVFSIPFALVALIAGISVIYLPLNNLSVSIAQGTVKAVRRLFIFPIQYNTIPSNEIKYLETKRSGSTGQGSKKIEHFKVILNTIHSKKITIAEDIDGQDLASQFKEFISSRISG